jgi:hypothetical protein
MRVLNESAIEPLRVIDWGAGRGRLAATLQDRLRTTVAIAGTIEYIAYDPIATHRVECCSAMRDIVSDPIDSYFDDISSLAAHLDRRKADMIVMCNVLHEIDPITWPDILQRDVASLLSDVGHVVIAEDLTMPHGEHANSYGFLVVDEGAVRRLFDDNDAMIKAFKPGEDRYKGRLATFVIPATLLQNVNSIH